MSDLQAIPWLPYLAIDYIYSFLTLPNLLNKWPDTRSVFEWGSGGSTIFFQEMRIPYLVSIEHDKEWYDRVGKHLRMSKSFFSSKHLFIPYEVGELGPDKANPAHYKSGSTELGPVNFKKYASAIDQYGKFDLILIDGMARASCLYHAISHVKPGGCIVLDNVGDRPYYLAQTDYLFGNYEDGWERIVFSGYGPILDYQWSTLILKNTRKSDYE